MPSNPPLERLYVPASRCHEVYYGSVHQDWIGEGYYEHEFQYYVDLLHPEINRPWYETNDVVYWLSIQAVFPAGWSQGQGGHTGWGWLSTHPSNNWNDASVVATNFSAAGPIWQRGIFRPASHPWAVDEEDLNLAFELTTDEVGTSQWHSAVWIKDIADDGSGGMQLPSQGDAGAGVQVLQCVTNLGMSNTWVDVSTNPLPLPLPWTNWWFDAGPPGSRVFYRILQQ
jgi:hypothetical protein